MKDAVAVPPGDVDMADERHCRFPNYLGTDAGVRKSAKGLVVFQICSVAGQQSGRGDARRGCTVLHSIGERIDAHDRDPWMLAIFLFGSSTSRVDYDNQVIVFGIAGHGHGEVIGDVHRRYTLLGSWKVKLRVGGLLDKLGELVYKFKSPRTTMRMVALSKSVKTTDTDCSLHPLNFRACSSREHRKRRFSLWRPATTMEYPLHQHLVRENRVSLPHALWGVDKMLYKSDRSTGNIARKIDDSCSFPTTERYRWCHIVPYGMYSAFTETLLEEECHMMMCVT
ncbi:hypothetical protein FN846DRAFT_985524 [Sphaerosporella brunnea]|uniref:Uncharacterized protein n=1 Tax=Sphaerosporella brunnea TaxID=1250544 RepID=A0A5J5EUJ1_9PEZI|nr:hypothetical protein FN846DRAFT_985524 [Sphaerosporella brunnea]